MKLIVRPSKPTDLMSVALTMRDADRRECWAGGLTPLQALENGYAMSSNCLTAYDEHGTAHVMFGAVPMQVGQLKVGIVWLLGSDDAVTKGKWSFLRQSRYWLEELDKEFELLCNYVDSRNTIHLRWLEWLGFKFLSSTTAHSVDGTPFIKFVRIRPHV